MVASELAGWLAGGDGDGEGDGDDDSGRDGKGLFQGSTHLLGRGGGQPTVDQINNKDASHLTLTQPCSRSLSVSPSLCSPRRLPARSPPVSRVASLARCFCQAPSTSVVLRSLIGRLTGCSARYSLSLWSVCCAVRAVRAVHLLSMSVLLSSSRLAVTRSNPNRLKVQADPVSCL